MQTLHTSRKELGSKQFAQVLQGTDACTRGFNSLTEVLCKVCLDILPHSTGSKSQRKWEVISSGVPQFAGMLHFNALLVGYEWNWAFHMDFWGSRVSSSTFPSWKSNIWSFRVGLSGGCGWHGSWSQNWAELNFPELAWFFGLHCI